MTSTILSPSATKIVEPKPPDLTNQTTSFAEKVSFAAALSKPKLKPRFPAIPIPTRQYGSLEGRPSVSFSAAEVDAGAKCFQYSLIAKFTVGRPSIDIIRQTFQSNWDIKGRATLSEIWDGRHLMVILDSEQDMVVALTSPVRKVQHALFRLFRYSPEYNPRRESTTTTKWIRLPSLPPSLFHREHIAAIINSFAVFLDTDDRTKACANLRYARACVELDVTHNIPEKIWISLPGSKGYWQEIVIEGNMSYCSHCKIHGHDLVTCRKKKPATLYEGHKLQEKVANEPYKASEKDTKKNTEWRVVESKRTANKVSMNPGYGPDLLYANTTQSTPTQTQVVPSVDKESDQCAVGRVSIDKSETETPNSGADKMSFTSQGILTQVGDTQSDDQTIKASFAMLENLNNGDSGNEVERNKLKEALSQMVERLAKMKNSVSSETISDARGDKSSSVIDKSSYNV